MSSHDDLPPALSAMWRASSADTRPSRGYWSWPLGYRYWPRSPMH